MRSFVLLPALLFVVACSSNTADPNGTQQPVSYGSYAGKVVLHGVSGDTLADQSGATVAIGGTSYSTTTDVNGNYLITHVPSGKYNLSFTKAGFDTAMVLGDLFSGADAGTMQTQHLQTIPYDSIVCERVQFYYDSIRRVGSSNEFDTTYGMILYVHTFGKDHPTFASVTVSRQHENGDTTMLGGGLFQLWRQGDDTVMYIRDAPFQALPHSNPKLGEKINILLRATTAPTLNLPIALSPYLTRTQVIVKVE